MRTLEDGDGDKEDPFDIEHLVDFPVCGLKRGPERSKHPRVNREREIHGEEKRRRIPANVIQGLEMI